MMLAVYPVNGLQPRDKAAVKTIPLTDFAWKRV